MPTMAGFVSFDSPAPIQIPYLMQKLWLRLPRANANSLVAFAIIDAKALACLSITMQETWHLALTSCKNAGKNFTHS
jgi:hypothetical protein